VSGKRSINGKRQNSCTQTNTCCAVCCMCDRVGVHGRTKRKEEKGRKGKRRRKRKKRKKRKKERTGEEGREWRLQLACREHLKSGEPHAPTQRWPTSRKSVDWSAKLCEKASKKKGRGEHQWPFLTDSMQHARAKSHEQRAMSHKQTHVGREWQEP
jgi:hypothetical protein